LTIRRPETRPIERFGVIGTPVIVSLPEIGPVSGPTCLTWIETVRALSVITRRATLFGP
jgi:hypothetical protein